MEWLLVWMDTLCPGWLVGGGGLVVTHTAKKRERYYLLGGGSAGVGCVVLCARVLDPEQNPRHAGTQRKKNSGRCTSCSCDSNVRTADVCSIAVVLYRYLLRSSLETESTAGKNDSNFPMGPRQNLMKKLVKLEKCMKKDFCVVFKRGKKSTQRLASGLLLLLPLHATWRMQEKEKKKRLKGMVRGTLRDNTTADDDDNG
ncbi:hypothetical protein GQ42DRAFT_93422 [Ramicandelaber brevisporus]|nr:hypothetical protein GQ42DRAFT_93422 [Ramicandelaber brevisporus]